MSVEATGARRRTETVGRPGELPLVVIVRDNAGQPVPDISVTFSALPSGSIEFPGGQPSLSVRTNARGEASTDYTPRSRGQQMIIAATDTHGKTTFTLDVFEPDSPVEVRGMDNGGHLVVARIPEPAPPQKDYTKALIALVAGILGLCFMAGLYSFTMSWLDREPIKVPEIHTVEKQIVVPPVDNQARAGVAEEKKRNDVQDARLIEEDNINWAIGGNAQRALSKNAALKRDFERFYRGESGRGASGSGDMCSGPHWALYEKCRPR